MYIAVRFRYAEAALNTRYHGFTVSN